MNSTMQNHPEGYKWPSDDCENMIPIDRVTIETQIQIASLNKRLDKLTNTVNALLDKEQQEQLLRLLA